jgi:hypothetical protein
MGCTSSKKRTTSIDDLTGQNKKKDGTPGDSGVVAKKNGQVTANDKPILRETAKQTSAEAPGGGDASKAIQIPGAHKSFLAPDGIPFIDEDVDDEMEGGATRVVAKADVNKNTVSPPAASPSANKPPIIVTPPTIVVAGEKPSQQQQQLKQEEEERKRAVAADILRRELDITTAKQDAPGGAGGGEVHVEQVTVTTTTTTEAQPVSH